MPGKYGDSLVANYELYKTQYGQLVDDKTISFIQDGVNVILRHYKSGKYTVGEAETQACSFAPAEKDDPCTRNFTSTEEARVRNVPTRSFPREIPEVGFILLAVGAIVFHKLERLSLPTRGRWGAFLVMLSANVLLFVAARRLTLSDGTYWQSIYAISMFFCGQQMWQIILFTVDSNGDSFKKLDESKGETEGYLRRRCSRAEKIFRQTTVGMPS